MSAVTGDQSNNRTGKKHREVIVGVNTDGSQMLGGCSATVFTHQRDDKLFKHRAGPYLQPKQALWRRRKRGVSIGQCSVVS